MFTLKTPAKINWFLSVLSQREDNYHEIISLMQSISLYDYLTFEYSDDIRVITESDIPLEENLVYKASVLLKKESNIKDGATITLKKEIPMSAGLGGGSSDAACTLTGLNRLWKLGKTKEELMRLGEMLGSDIPFFLNGPFAMVEGRGEIVTPLRASMPNVVLLVKPPISISTKWAYSEVNRLLTKLVGRDDNIKLFCQSLDKQDFKNIDLKNDLEVPAVREFKVIGEIKDMMIKEGAYASLMSGSGPTVFGIFENRAKAEKAAESMKPNWCRVVETITAVNSKQ